MSFWGIRNRPINQLTAGTNQLTAGHNAAFLHSETNELLSEDTQWEANSINKWNACNIGLILQDLVQAKQCRMKLALLVLDLAK